MLKRVVCGQKALPQKCAPAQLSHSVVQERGVVKEDSQSIQSVGAGEGVEVDGSRLPCLRLLPNFRQKEDRRGLSWLWPLPMVARKWTDVAGRKINPRVFTW